jgi:hypothetical protein
MSGCGGWFEKYTYKVTVLMEAPTCRLFIEICILRFDGSMRLPPVKIQTNNKVSSRISYTCHNVYLY